MVDAPHDWKEENNSLVREYEFTDFLEAMEFVNKVGYYSEKLKHHPDFEIKYNKVKLTITTHDKGNKITDKDIELAKKINSFDDVDLEERDKKEEDESSGKKGKKKNKGEEEE
ncbi:4a-hydroxytetrahydrobiopterin dehydratase [Candidatus Pacearchaeota archaeon CG10_big_fil_rev_8_21_14_0_10_32_14]|nr:MAG: 4a-hydroxytetrahydrobiopterin dehydratase [Candidatus Pacearchaeota archaeon CG10_big_fil_rev_8_21_14_0_10_32_14]